MLTNCHMKSPSHIGALQQYLYVNKWFKFKYSNFVNEGSFQTHINENDELNF